MITNCDDSMASWNDDGTEMVIKDKETFSNSVIPQYLSSIKYQSFVRQLNFYGFNKVMVSFISMICPASNYCTI